LWAARAAQHFFGLSWYPLAKNRGYIVLLGALIASWQVYVTFAHPSELPGLSEVVWALVEGRMGYGYLAVATWISLVVLALGLYIGVVIAVLLVILATWTRMRTIY
jgi:ABC-type nitrate/sulfonate/bicarbonate transport system permease component